MKNKILFVVCILMGLIFINAGLNKFFNYMPMPENLPQEVLEMAEAMMQLKWLMPLIGFFEVVGGVLILIPKLRALGALILFPIMVGIITHHITLGDFNPIPLILAIGLIWIMYVNKDKYLPIVN